MLSRLLQPHHLSIPYPLSFVSIDTHGNGIAECNTPDMICLICNPTLAVSGVKLFYFLGFGFLSPCVVVVVMHLISCHHVHCICIRVRLMHSSISPLFVLHSGAPFSSDGHFYLSFVCGD